MKIKDLSQEELENMSYDDIAYMILQEAGKKMKINDLFKKVCKTLKLSDDVFESHIAAFFELLFTEKRFVMLENGYWDLRDNHSKQVVIDEDDEDEEEFVVVEDEEETDEEEKDIYEENDETDDIVEDDLKDFAVISEDDEENDSLE